MSAAKADPRGAPMSTDGYLTAQDVAQLIAVSVWTARDLMREGQIKAHKPGRQWLTTRRAVDEYAQGRSARRGRGRAA